MTSLQFNVVENGMVVKRISIPVLMHNGSAYLMFPHTPNPWAYGPGYSTRADMIKAGQEYIQQILTEERCAGSSVRADRLATHHQVDTVTLRKMFPDKFM